MGEGGWDGTSLCPTLMTTAWAGQWDLPRTGGILRGETLMHFSRADPLLSIFLRSNMLSVNTCTE